jgi:GTP-binding protein HflX
VWLSAATGAGLELLRDALAERFGARLVRVTLRLAARHGRARAELYRRGAVLAEAATDDGGSQLEIELGDRDLDALCRREGLERPVSSPCVTGGGFLQSRPAASPSL